MLAIIRLRGSVKMNKKIQSTLNMLGLRKVNTLILTEKSPHAIKTIKKIESYVAWGEITEDIIKKIGGKKIHLKPPKKGLKSIKLPYPKGDLGNHSTNIHKLIEKMI